MGVLIEWALFGHTELSEFDIPIHAELFVQLIQAITGAKLIRVCPCT